MPVKQTETLCVPRCKGSLTLLQHLTVMSRRRTRTSQCNDTLIKTIWILKSRYHQIYNNKSWMNWNKNLYLLSAQVGTVDNGSNSKWCDLLPQREQTALDNDCTCVPDIHLLHSASSSRFLRLQLCGGRFLLLSVHCSLLLTQDFVVDMKYN